MCDYIEERPALVAGLSRAGARVVVFELPLFTEALFVAVQARLERAVAAVPEDIRPLFVAVVYMSDWKDVIRAAKVRPANPWASPPMVCARGAFVGYLGLGWGGGIFIQAQGKPGYPTDEQVLALLRDDP